jgi:hypothetical protein
MRKKRVTVPRGSLSPYTASAIIQLAQEFCRKEDAKQCLSLAEIFKDRAAQLKKEPCRQPSKKKKRSEADKAKRAEAFAKIKAGNYTPVAIAAIIGEAAAVRQEYQPPAPPPVQRPTAAAIAADQARRIDIEIGKERGEAWAQDAYECASPAAAAPQPHAQYVQPHAQAVYEPVHEESGYDIYWRRQEAQEAAQREQEAAQRPVPPAAPQSSAPRIPQKGEPGYVTWLYTEIAKRKAAGTWTE